MSSTVAVLFIVAICVCALLVAYWAMVVGALNRMTRTDARRAADKHLGGANLVKIMERRPAALCAVSLLRTLSAIVCTVLIGVGWHYLPGSIWLHAGATIISTSLLLLIAVLAVPGSIGYRHPLNVLASCSHILWFATRIVGIVVKRREPDEDLLDQQQENQLAVAVERVSESAAVEDDERVLLHSVFELDSTYIREVMVPRTDVVSIGGDVSLDKALSLFNRSGFSRVPVIGDDADDVQGVLYLKDVIKRVHHRCDAEELKTRDVMREAVFVPETKRVDDMLHQMQASTVHIALVVDEYGGVAGLVTIEDLLEELVGDMVDEHDKAEPDIEKLSEGVYRVPARMPIDELGDLYGLTLTDDDVDSVGGLLAKANGRVPIAGAQGIIYGIHMMADRFEGRRKRLSTVIVSQVDQDRAPDSFVSVDQIADSEDNDVRKGSESE